MQKLFYYILAVAFLSSCIKDVEMPSSEGLVAVNAFLKNGENGFNIHINKSNAFTNPAWPETITDAEVRYRANAGVWNFVNLCDTAFDEPLNQFCVHRQISSKDVFEISVNYGDEPTLKAQAVVPDMPEIKDTIFTEQTVNFLLNQPKGEHYFIVDLIYYETTYNSNFEPVVIVQPNQISTSNATLELLGSSNELIDLPIDESYGTMAFVSSQSVPTEWRPINLSYYSGFGGQSSYYLRIRKCGFSYYEYQRTKILNRQSNDNPFIQPVNYHSNVTNGLGVFGAYSEKIIKLN